MVRKMMSCKSCGTPIAVADASKPCPTCGEMDRDVTSGDVGQGVDDWSELVEIFRTASPEDIATALTEIGAELGAGVTIKADEAGFTITRRNGPSHRYAFAQVAAASAMAFDSTAVANVSARFQALPPAEAGAPLTVRQALKVMLASSKFGGLIVLATGANPAAGAILFLVATGIEAIEAAIDATKPQ